MADETGTMKSTKKKPSHARGGSKATPRPRATASTVRATSPRRSVFPAYLSSSPDTWRSQKAQEWKEVRFALERYLYGSAYTPAQAELYRLQKLAVNISEALEGQWVAW